MCRGGGPGQEGALSAARTGAAQGAHSPTKGGEGDLELGGRAWNASSQAVPVTPASRRLRLGSSSTTAAASWSPVGLCRQQATRRSVKSDGRTASFSSANQRDFKSSTDVCRSTPFTATYCAPSTSIGLTHSTSRDSVVACRVIGDTQLGCGVTRAHGGGDSVAERARWRHEGRGEKAPGSVGSTVKERRTMPTKCHASALQWRLHASAFSATRVCSHQRLPSHTLLDVHEGRCAEEVGVNHSEPAPSAAQCVKKSF